MQHNFGDRSGPMRSPIPFGSMLRGAQPLGAAADLDLARYLQALAVEAQHRKRVVNHALHEQGLTVTTPNYALAPSSGLGFGDLGKVRSIHAEDCDKRVIIIEGMRRRPSGALLRCDGDIASVIGERQTLDDLATSS